MPFTYDNESMIYKVSDSNGYTNYIFKKIDGYFELLLVRFEKYSDFGLDYVIEGFPRAFNNNILGAEYRKIVIKKDDDIREMDINSINVIVNDIIISNGIEYRKNGHEFISFNKMKYEGTLKMDDSYFISFLNGNRSFSVPVNNSKEKRFKRILSLFKK